MTGIERYRCPACREPLADGDDDWSCTGCGVRYPVRRGVPTLIRAESRSPGFVGVMKRSYEEPDKFLDLAEASGWEAALRAIQVPGEPDRLREAIAPNRVTWRHAAGVAPGTLVVDIGAGTGGVACQLAAQCDVISVDRSFVDAAFVGVRARQQALRGLQSIVAEACELPLRDAVADVVTLIGVLEWIPTDFPGRDPRESQLHALREVRRVLKPGGRLYLAIENRYYFGYYLGVPEPHARLRHLSLMGRSEADRYSRETRGKPYLELTHSLGEYRALLAEAGFAQVDAYWLHPNYRLTHFMVPAAGPEPAQWLAEKMLDPRKFDGVFGRKLYAMYRFAPPQARLEMVRDFGFVGHA
jgi:SAM-dependent methyltransferase